ncbi:MAG: hypothetical protein J6I76_19390 [Oribacterium sp.]|nr:hypothetical protein [Oribacterium sp.]
MFKRFLIMIIAGAIIMTSIGCSTKVNAMEKNDLQIETASSDVDVFTEDIPDIVVGGWRASEDVKMTDEAKNAFEKAVSGLTGVNYEPVACLGTQVVAGTNYCILCKATPVTLQATTYYTLVYVYEDLEENAEIASIKNIELGF